MKNLLKIGCGGIVAVVCLAIAIALIKGGDSSTTTAATTVERKQSNELTLAQYEQLKTGMTAEEVAGVLKTSGEEQSSSEVQAGSFTTSSTVRTYRGNGFMAGTITVIYSDGRLMSKSQFGLK